jgi:hypothetical protein
MMHSHNWLEEPVFGTTFWYDKGKKLSKRFFENNLSIRNDIRCMPPKNISANHNVEHAIMWYMEIKEIHIHASGRFIE